MQKYNSTGNRVHVCKTKLTYHVQICLRDNRFKFLALFAINNPLNNHVNRAVHIFIKQFVEHFLFLLKNKC